MATIHYIIGCASLVSACAFQPSIPARWNSRLFALSTADDAKINLVTIANRLQADQGIFLYDKTAKEELTKAVSALEAVASAPTRDDFDDRFQGDWTLVVTTATNSAGFDLSKLPFLNEGPLKEIRATLNRSIRVEQRIRSTTNSTVVDRVDHVIQFQPPNMLMDVLGGDVPDALRSINVNPLEVTKATVTLVHKATVESVIPVLKTKICLESVILTVAGKSQLLDPAGANVLGINLPLSEFLNAGTFETTFMDSNLRISRGKLGLVDQLRVFTRNIQVEIMEAELVVEQTSGDTAPSDVELGENAGEVIVNGSMDVQNEMRAEESEEGEQTFPPSESNRI